MKPYDSLDTLYDFLKNIATVDEFFEKKEPSHDDEFMRSMALLDIASGIPEEHVLGGLKTAERRRYAETLTQRQLPHIDLCPAQKRCMAIHVPRAAPIRSSCKKVLWQLVLDHLAAEATMHVNLSANSHTAQLHQAAQVLL